MLEPNPNSNLYLSKTMPEPNPNSNLNLSKTGLWWWWCTWVLNWKKTSASQHRLTETQSEGHFTRNA